MSRTWMQKMRSEYENDGGNMTKASFSLPEYHDSDEETVATACQGISWTSVESLSRIQESPIPSNERRLSGWKFVIGEGSGKSSKNKNTSKKQKSKKSEPRNSWWNLNDEDEPEKSVKEKTKGAKARHSWPVTFTENVDVIKSRSKSPDKTIKKTKKKKAKTPDKKKSKKSKRKHRQDKKEIPTSSGTESDTQPLSLPLSLPLTVPPCEVLSSSAPEESDKSSLPLSVASTEAMGKETSSLQSFDAAQAFNINARKLQLLAALQESFEGHQEDLSCATSLYEIQSHATPLSLETIFGGVATNEGDEYEEETIVEEEEEYEEETVACEYYEEEVSQASPRATASMPRRLSM
ncbi:MAG: hypothetical protein SGBAC_011282 [Bacillariaceae sp.]